MKNIRPSQPRTYVNPKSQEWIPKTFEGFLAELGHLVSSCRNSESLVLFRGHKRREWILDSTFVRSCKAALFGLPPESRLSGVISESQELHLALLNLFLLKYGVLIRPSSELEDLAIKNGLDAWFELMKRHQQFPEDDRCHLKGSNLLDWTKSAEVALYFANSNESSDGAVYILDATATGKSLQIFPVGDILDKMAKIGNEGKSLGIPLLFCPSKQIHNMRANNQQAIYVAQMDLQYDLETHWRLLEKEVGETIFVKLVLPSGTEEKVDKYLTTKGITHSFIYPD